MQQPRLLRATCPEDAVRDGKEAVTLATKACEQTISKSRPRWTHWRRLTPSGDFEQAIKYQKRCLEFVECRNQKPGRYERPAQIV